jgi:CBS domain-containing protein
MRWRHLLALFALASVLLVLVLVLRGTGAELAGVRTPIALIWSTAALMLALILALAGLLRELRREPEEFGELRVGDVMRSAPRPIAPSASLDALERRLRREGLSALLVAEGDRVVGVVGWTRLSEVLPAARDKTRVETVMASPLPHVTRVMLLSAANQHLERLHVEILPVIEDDELLGVVQRETPKLFATPTSPRATAPTAQPTLQAEGDPSSP